MKVRLMNKEKLHKKTHENFELHSICAPRQSQKFHAKTFAIIKTRRANSKSMMMISKTSTILFEREREKEKRTFHCAFFRSSAPKPPAGWMLKSVCSERMRGNENCMKVLNYIQKHLRCLRHAGHPPLS